MRRDYYSFTVVTIVTIGSKNGDGSSIASDFRFSIWIEILRTGWWLKYWEAPQLTWACARALTPQEEVGGDLPSSTLRQVIRGHESLRWLFSFSKSAAAKNKKWNTPSGVRRPAAIHATHAIALPRVHSWLLPLAYRKQKLANHPKPVKLTHSRRSRVPSLQLNCAGHLTTV